MPMTPTGYRQAQGRGPRRPLPQRQRHAGARDARRRPDRRAGTLVRVPAHPGVRGCGRWQDGAAPAQALARRPPRSTTTASCTSRTAGLSSRACGRGWARRAAARRAASGRRAARARPSGRSRGRARAARAAAPATAARIRSLPTGRRRAPAGRDVRQRQLVGVHVVELLPAQRRGDLLRPARAPDQAPKTVLCGAFWL